MAQIFPPFPTLVCLNTDRKTFNARVDGVMDGVWEAEEFGGDGFL